MSSNTLHTESTARTASQAPEGRRAPRRGTVQDALTASPDGTRPSPGHTDAAAVPSGLSDNSATQIASRRGHGRHRAGANVLALLGLAGIAGNVWALAWLGELDRIRYFIGESASFNIFSATEAVYYPSAQGYLGLVFAGPAGMILTASLVICTGLGMLALRIDRRSRPSVINKALPLATALLLPLLVVNFTIYSAIEFASAQNLPIVLEDAPGWVGVWVVTALISAAAIGLTSNGLMLRWAWRREKCLAGASWEPAAA